MNERPDMDDLPHTEWKCEECAAVNSCLDGDCQFCDGKPIVETRRMFKNVNDAMSFIQAGNATITVVSKATGKRHTFKITESKDGKLFFVGRMTGPDNEASFSYVAVIREGEFRKSNKSKDDIGFAAFDWVWRRLSNGILPPPDVLEIWHEGRCGACGRKLTVPESIERGIGPECAKGMLPKTPDYLGSALQFALGRGA